MTSKKRKWPHHLIFNRSFLLTAIHTDCVARIIRELYSIFQVSIMAEYRLRPLGSVYDRKRRQQLTDRPWLFIRVPLTLYISRVDVIWTLFYLNNGGMSISTTWRRRRPEITSYLNLLTSSLKRWSVEVLYISLAINKLVVTTDWAFKWAFGAKNRYWRLTELGKNATR